MKMIHEIGRAVFLTTEYRTVNAAFLTSNPEEQERRFFYALMLRSRAERALIYAASRARNRGSKGKIPFPLKSVFYCVTNPQQRS